jgi:uncharacterized membrane protein HdeD (DUF308 family)
LFFAWYTAENEQKKVPARYQQQPKPYLRRIRFMATATVQSNPINTVPWWLVLMQGIAGVIIGILLLLQPVPSTALLIQLLGIYWLVGGIFEIISIFMDSSRWGWKLFSGIIGILAGIAIIQHPVWATLLVPATLVIILGVFGLIIGVINLIQAFQGGGWGIGLLGVVSIAFGLLLLGNTLVATLTLPYVFGAFALVGGVIAILAAFRMR